MTMLPDTSSPACPRRTARYRHLGCPNALPLKWLPDRVRIDVLTLTKAFNNNRLTGVVSMLAVAALGAFTVLVISNPVETGPTANLAALDLTADHPQHTTQ